MTVNNGDPLESVICKALADVETNPDEMVVPDVHGSGIIERMNVVAVGNLRCHQHDFRSAPAGLHAHTVADKVVDVERQMRAVLFGRTNGQQDHLAQRNRLVDLRPGQIAVNISFSDWLWLGQDDLACGYACAARPCLRKELAM